MDNYSLFKRHIVWLPGIHPTQEGYQALAENWFRALVQCGLLNMFNQ